MEKLNSNVSARQIILFFALFSPVAKLFIMPASYCFYAGKDCWIGVIFQGVIDVLCLLAILYVMKNDGRSLSDILDGAIGIAGRKVFMLLFSLYFLAKSVVPILEELLICYEVLYESTPKLIFFIPLFFAMFYSAISGFNGTLRTIELFAPFVAFSLFGIGFLSVSSLDIEELFPIFEFGVRPLGTGVIAHLGWFGDFSVLLLLLNNCHVGKKQVKHIALSYFIGIAIVAAFLVVTVEIFGNSAPRQVFMLSKISKYSIAFSNLGRIDFLFIIVLFMATTLFTCIYITAAVKCLSSVTELKPWINSLIATVMIGTFSIAMLERTYSVIEFVQKYSLALFAPFQYVFPFALALISKHSRRNEKINQRKQPA